MQTLRCAGKLCASFAARPSATGLLRQLATVAASNPVYEIRFYQMKPDRFRESLDLLQKYWPVRIAHSKAVGSWKTEIGGICETVHLWEYESLKDRMTRRQGVAEDQVWQKEFMPKFFDNSLKLTNVLTSLAPGSTLTTSFNPSSEAIYELQRCEPYAPLILKQEGEAVVGHFMTVYGPGSSEYVLIRYLDPDVAFKSAYERRKTQSVRGYSRFMVPCEWSDLQ